MLIYFRETKRNTRLKSCDIEIPQKEKINSLMFFFLSFTFLFHFLKSQDAQWTLGKKDWPLKKQLTSPMKGKQTKKKNYNTVKIIYTCCPFLFSNNL